MSVRRVPDFVGVARHDPLMTQRERALRQRGDLPRLIVSTLPIDVQLDIEILENGCGPVIGKVVGNNHLIDLRQQVTDRLPDDVGFIFDQHDGADGHEAASLAAADNRLSRVGERALISRQNLIDPASVLQAPVLEPHDGLAYVRDLIQAMAHEENGTAVIVKPLDLL